MTDDSILRFYHISRDASEEKINKFSSEGIVPLLGNGYGGQKKGFYCWTNEHRANKYYCSLLVAVDADWAMENFGIDIRLKNGKALKIEIPVQKNAIRYPDWQLDNEQHPSIKRGRVRSIFLGFWETQKKEFNIDVNYEVENSLGEKYVVKRLDWDKKSHCPIIEWINPKGEIETQKADNTNANNSFRTQTINDCLCNHSVSYNCNYNRLIQAVATNQDTLEIDGTLLHTSDIPIKYCSSVPIKNFKITKIYGTATCTSPTETKTESNTQIRWGDYLIKMDEYTVANIENNIWQSKVTKDRRVISIAEQLVKVRAKIRHSYTSKDNYSRCSYKNLAENIRRILHKKAPRT